jgi:phenylpropionate dioxygenase-like ring-hydroxylating dioxygenase large terminal subunit
VACNWLQAFEVGIDPAHASFLHRFLQDEALEPLALRPASSSAVPALGEVTASAGR